MTPDRGLYSDTTKEMKKPNVELLCQWTKIMAPDLTRTGSQKKNWTVSVEMDGIKDEEEAGKILKLRKTIEMLNRVRLMKPCKG
jgi:hypothetical protein